jgi:hypothetical protein
MRLKHSPYICTALGVLFFVVSVGSSPVAEAQELRVSTPIKELVKQSILEEVVVGHYPPADVSELVAASDLIVEVTIASQRSFVHGDSVWTDYGVQIARTLQSREPRVERGTLLTVRKRGGTVPVDGRTFISVDSQFPAFQAGEQYLLFLRADSDSTVYDVFAGPCGALRVVDGSVTGTLPLTEFRDTVVRHAASRTSAEPPTR